MNDTKICGKCKQELPLSSEFYHRMKSTADGFRGTCKACRKQRDEHVAEHGVEEKVLDGTKRCCMCKEKLPATTEHFHKDKNDKNYGVTNVCKPCSKIYQKQYKVENKEKVAEWGYEYRDRDVVKEARSEYNKQYREENYQECLEKALEYRKNNRKELAARSKKWREDNPEEYRRTQNRCHKKKAAIDPLYRLQKNLRRRLSQAINGETKSETTMKLTGCGINELKLHLESLFEDWMTWDNYGSYVLNGPRKWCVDHIKPCASFDLSKPEEQQKCFHYSNLQPLCSKENGIKSDRLDYPTKKGSNQ